MAVFSGPFPLLLVLVAVALAIISRGRRMVQHSHVDRFRSTAAVLFALVFFCSPAAAHDLPTNTLMNAFEKIEAKQAQLVVRLPLDLLRGLPFPQQGSQYDLAASGPMTQLALLTLADGFIIQVNGVRLTPAAASGRLSPPSDRSFSGQVPPTADR